MADIDLEQEAHRRGYPNYRSLQYAMRRQAEKEAEQAGRAAQVDYMRDMEMRRRATLAGGSSPIMTPRLDPVVLREAKARREGRDGGSR
jgi:hypothetical protein